MEGIVNWFNVNKGFGFVKGEDDVDYFVHISSIPKDVILKEGDKISFIVKSTDRGKQAVDVERIDD